MITFELTLNGKKLSTAGQNDLDVLSLHVSAVGCLGEKSEGTLTVKEGYEISFGLSGVADIDIFDQLSHLYWISETSLKPGDEILLEVLESDSADEPIDPISAQVTPQEFEKYRRESWEKARDLYFQLKEKYE